MSLLLETFVNFAKFDQLGLRRFSFQNRYILIDGTDAPIVQPSQFSSGWFSYKLNGPLLKYDAETSIYGKHLVRIDKAIRPEDFNDA